MMQDTVLASDEPMDTIVVTGTRTVYRTAFDTASPIDVLTGEELEATVSAELADSLAQLLPSFNVQRLPMADGNVLVRPARLRNLSPDHTLVLVNGKRRHRTAHLGNRGAQPVDLAKLPSFAIKRVEVLRDGASAQYGSDAIAGVINLILHDEAGISAFAQGSEYYEGDGTQIQLGMRAGLSLDDRGSVVLTAEYTDADRTSRSIQRPDAIVFQSDGIRRAGAFRKGPGPVWQGSGYRWKSGNRALMLPIRNDLHFIALLPKPAIVDVY